MICINDVVNKSKECSECVVNSVAKCSKRKEETPVFKGFFCT